MKNLKIRGKLLSAFTVLVLALTLISGAVFMKIVFVQSSVATSQLSDQKRDALDQTLIALVERQNAVRGYLMSGEQSFVKTALEQNARIKTHLSQLAQMATPEESATIGRLPAMVDGVWAELTALMAESDKPETRAKAHATVGSRARITDIRAVLTDLVKRTDESVSTNQGARDAAIIRVLSLMAAGGIMSIAISLVLALLLNRAIGKPVLEMSQVMSALAEGRQDTRVPGLERRDEIGSMARAVRVFKLATEEKLQLEQTEVLRREADEARIRNDLEKAEVAAQQASAIDTIGTALAALERGDLTCRIADLPASFSKLEANYNAAIERLEGALRSVIESSHAIHGNTSEVATASNNIATRTEQQAASVEETAAALEQITRTVEQTADGAQRASTIAGAACAEAECSRDVLKETVLAIQRIEASSKQISTIIGVIDEIAFQTSLLALNAGVEAARAGSAGRGFAVVAAEVRALAQRSAEAAKEIKSLISSAQTEVADGVSLVGRTGEAMTRIFQQVNAADQVLTEIARGAREQSTGLREVNTAVAQMDQITQQNAAMIEEASAASEQLFSEAGNLKRLVQHFRMEPAGRAPMRLAS